MFTCKWRASDNLEHLFFLFHCTNTFSFISRASSAMLDPDDNDNLPRRGRRLMFNIIQSTSFFYLLSCLEFNSCLFLRPFNINTIQLILQRIINNHLLTFTLDFFTVLQTCWHWTRRDESIRYVITITITIYNVHWCSFDMVCYRQSLL